MELIIYGAGVPIRLYSSQIYLDKEYHLNNADDLSAPRLNPTICFDFDD